MTQKEMRSIAMGSVRAEARLRGFIAENLNAYRALAILDDFARVHKDTVAAQWWESASSSQEKLFIKEWGKWAEQQ